MKKLSKYAVMQRIAMLLAFAALLCAHSFSLSAQAVRVTGTVTGVGGV